MRNFRKIIFIFLTILCSSCTTTPNDIYPRADFHSTDESIKARNIESVNGKSVVYIIRDNRKWIALWHSVIGVNGRVVGKLSSGSFFKLILEPGDYRLAGFYAAPQGEKGVFWVSDTKEKDFNFRFDPDKVYFLNQDDEGVCFGTPCNARFTSIEKSEALAMLHRAGLVRYEVDSELVNYRESLEARYKIYSDEQRKIRDQEWREKRSKEAAKYAEERRLAESASRQAASTQASTSKGAGEAIEVLLAVLLIGVLIFTAASVSQPHYTAPPVTYVPSIQQNLDASLNRDANKPIGSSSNSYSYKSSPYSYNSGAKQPLERVEDSRVYYSKGNVDWKVSGNTITSNKGDKYRIEGESIYSQTGKRYRIVGSDIYGDDGSHCKVIANQVICN